jgi:phospholipase/carboxylesterase
MHPLIPWTPEPQPGLSAKRILITAGRRDPICPAPMTEALARYLTDQGAALTLHWHDGGHELRQEELSAIQAFLG